MQKEYALWAFVEIRNEHVGFAGKSDYSYILDFLESDAHFSSCSANKLKRQLSARFMQRDVFPPIAISLGSNSANIWNARTGIRPKKE